MLRGTDTILGPDPPESEYLEAYRQLRASIFALRQQWEPLSILVTSAMPDEGKSTVAINLATVLALADKKTVLVDLDLRHPQAHRLLDEPLPPGITDALMQTVALAEVTRTSTGLEHLSVITAGSYVAQGPDILAAQGPRQILATLCQQHDCVIMDSTPVLEFAVALDLGPMVDCVLMVARARRSVAPVVRAIKMLEDIGAEVPGIVVNDVLPEDELSAQYGYYGASASLSSPQ